MTYKPKEKAEYADLVATSAPQTARKATVRLADEEPQAAAPEQDETPTHKPHHAPHEKHEHKPHAHVSHVSNHATLAPRHEQGVAHSG